MHALAVEATIDAAEVALEELQRLFTVFAADELQRLRLPPGIAVRTARLAEIAGLLGETAALLQGPVVATDDEPSEPPPTAAQARALPRASRLTCGRRARASRGGGTAPSAVHRRRAGGSLGRSRARRNRAVWPSPNSTPCLLATPSRLLAARPPMPPAPAPAPACARTRRSPRTDSRTGARVGARVGGGAGD